MSAVFSSLVSKREFDRQVQQFLQVLDTPIPVWCGKRNDIVETVALANTMYQGIEKPSPADVGVFLVESDLDTQLKEFILPLAQRWISAKELLHDIQHVSDVRLLIVGLYSSLTWNNVNPLLQAAYCNAGFRIGFLSGRDQHSLQWMAAKQWGRLCADIVDSGFFSSIDSPAPTKSTEVFSEKDFARDDIDKIVLQKPWNRILFQGHGKDDSINLGDYTICGANSHVGAAPDVLYPRCGYGFSCYKNEDKLILLRKFCTF